MMFLIPYVQWGLGTVCVVAPRWLAWMVAFLGWLPCRLSWLAALSRLAGLLGWPRLALLASWLAALLCLASLANDGSESIL